MKLPQIDWCSRGRSTRNGSLQAICSAGGLLIYDNLMKLRRHGLTRMSLVNASCARRKSYLVMAMHFPDAALHAVLMLAYKFIGAPFGVRSGDFILCFSSS